MLIGGFQKLTLIDYPKKIATIVFTVGCNFRCGFCYNLDLVIPSRKKSLTLTKEDDFFDFLASRKGKLEAVVVTGGEPTLQKDLEIFLKKIKSLGFLVKLDTNGTAPEKIKKLIKKGLVDYIAMDIKNRLTESKYKKIVGTKVDINAIKKSIKLLMENKIDYEFRTTMAPGITKEDLLSIAKSIKGAKKYFLQEFKDTEVIDLGCKKDAWLKEEELKDFKKEIDKLVKYSKIR